MAAGILPPETGSEFSPCLKCEHVDCAAVRVTAGSICRHCDKPIGWETRFYKDDNRLYRTGEVAAGAEWVHALCEELAIEEEQKNR